MNTTTRFIVTALIAGALGGGITYGGIHHFQMNNANNSGGRITEVRGTTNVQNQSEKAFKSVHNDVVSVINLRKVGNNPILKLFGVNQSQSQNKLQAMSEGSGVIYKVSHNTAYIVTNDHVVQGSNQLRIVLNSGKKVTAKVVGTNKNDDLAVMKMPANGIKQVAHFGNSNNIQAGETSLAIGSPLGSSYASTLTKGIISNKSRKIQKANNQKGTSRVIQTDAAINPGNSGGALINLNGQVIGINSAKVASTPQGSSVEGMGFAIPSNEVVHVINQIIAKK